jgi:hypothetical protein
MGTVSSRRGTIGYLLSTWLLRMAACTRCAYCTAPLFRWKRFSSTVLTDLLCRHSTSSNWHFHLSLNWYPVRVMGVSPDGQYFAELQHLCACQYQPINLYMFLVILQNLPLGDPRVPVINRSCIWTFAWTSLLLITLTKKPVPCSRTLYNKKGRAIVGFSFAIWKLYPIIFRQFWKPFIRPRLSNSLFPRLSSCRLSS